MAAGTRLLMSDTEQQAPKDVHIIIPQACDGANLPGKSNSVDVIKLRISDEESILEYPGRPDVITSLLTPKSLQMVIAAMKLKDTCSLEEKL